jgi:hypothetical protein
MRITAALGFIFVLLLSAPVFGQSFVGRWTATAQTPGGGVSETVTVTKTKDGYVITAKLVNPPAPGTPEAGPGTDIEVNGDRFSYRRSVMTPDGTLVINYTGVVSGDTFTGTVEILGSSVPYTGVRIKDSG